VLANIMAVEKTIRLAVLPMISGVMLLMPISTLSTA
jgi:hypothetical protein